MSPLVAIQHYTDLAHAAENGTSRSVYMLGMLCANAAARGVLVSFRRDGENSDWPDPRLLSERHRRTSD